ncbi:MAG: hypothetical protein ACHQIM_03660 [Sphingobacteriales bacterium]
MKRQVPRHHSMAAISCLLITCSKISGRCHWQALEPCAQRHDANALALIAKCSGHPTWFECLTMTAAINGDLFTSC